MIKLKFVLFVAALAALILPRVAHAQAAANISVLQGSGQMICDGCPTGVFTQFDDLIVLVTDARGNPVPNAVVTWQVTSSPGGGTMAQAQTVTGTATGSSATLCTAVGHSCNTFLENTTATLNIIQSTVTASITNVQSVTFYLTQIPPPNSQTFQIFANPQLIFPQPGQNMFTGAAGSTSGTPIQVSVVTNNGTPIQNVSVRLYPNAGNPAGGPSVSCVTAPGADPGAVLTDATGNANCFLLFGSVPTPGGANGIPTPFYVLVGGVASLQNGEDNNGTTGVPVGFSSFPLPINIVVTAVTPKSLTIVSGNSQTALAGTAVANPLVVQELDTNSNPLSGQTVTWSVSPAGAATLNPGTGPTGSNGQASTNVTLASTASGTVTVTATVSGLTPVNFSITATQPLPSLSSLTIVSGNNQSQQEGAAFSLPLVVQATLANGGAASGVTVNFAITGGSGVLSAPSAPTQSNGQASVGVTAGSSPGALTIVASVSGFSQTVTFNLTVTPPPPPISSAGFLNGAGFFPTAGTNQTALSPCGVATLVVGSPLPASAFPTTANMYPAPLQQTNNITITFPTAAAPAPLLNVSTASTGQQLITFQVPCEIVANDYSATVSINGNSVTVPNVTVRPGAPGIFELISSDGVRRAIAVRPDGSFVSPANPARRGEFIVFYITGAGPVLPALTSGALPTPGVNSIPTDPNQVIVGLNGQGVGSVTVQAAAELIGVYQVTFLVPTSSSIVQTGDNILAVGVIAEGNPIQFQQPNGSKLPIN